MDITDIENLKFIIPIMGVIGLGSFIFLFGFKHSVTPPSFEDLIDIDNKKGKKKKTKYDKLKISSPKPKESTAKKPIQQGKTKKEETLNHITNDVKDTKRPINDNKKEAKIAKGKSELPLKGKKVPDTEKLQNAADGWMTIPQRKDKKVTGVPFTKQAGKSNFSGSEDREGRSSTSPEVTNQSQTSLDKVNFGDKQKKMNNTTTVSSMQLANQKGVKNKEKSKIKDASMPGLKNISEAAHHGSDLDVESGTYYDNDNYDGYNDDQPQFVPKIVHDNQHMSSTTDKVSGGKSSGHLPSFSSSTSSHTSSRDTISNEWELINHPTPPNEASANNQHSNAPIPYVAIKPIIKLTTDDEWVGTAGNGIDEAGAKVDPYMSQLTQGLTNPDPGNYWSSSLGTLVCEPWLNDYASYLYDADVCTTNTKVSSQISPVQRALLDEIKRKKTLVRDRVPDAFTFEEDGPHGSSNKVESLGTGGNAPKPYYQTSNTTGGKGHHEESRGGILPEAYGGPSKRSKKKEAVEVAPKKPSVNHATMNGHVSSSPLVKDDDMPTAEGGVDSGTIKKAKKKKKKSAGGLGDQGMTVDA